MKRATLWAALGLLAACGGGGPADEGERCGELGAMSCSFSGSEVLLCVDKRWTVQESCDLGTEDCTLSKGEAFCSYGGEPCDEVGATKCDTNFTLVSCDGKAWELLSECFPGTCETENGESYCSGA